MTYQTSPMADRLRPKNLSEFVGQEHLVGEGKILRELLRNEQSKKQVSQFPSVIFWGPPGTGKTTLAKIIANEVDAQFVQLSATMSGVKEIREVVKQAKNSPLFKTILFIDEIHRFNKSQQDSLLPHVENGTLTIIGATTENPSFEVNSALLSRCRVLTLKQLEEKDIEKIVIRGLEELKSEYSVESGPEPSRKVGQPQGAPLQIEADALNLLMKSANGDARFALNTLEMAVQIVAGAYMGAPQQTNSVIRSKQKVQNKHKSDVMEDPSVRPYIEKLIITKSHIQEGLQNPHLVYDRAGDEHYNTISAFIKSMRASDANAAVYYLARMIEAGEDPKFIARRMVIFASEDIGVAQPTALVVANEVFRACETIGYPECGINLAHGVIYLSKAKKDRSVYDGLRAAQADVKEFGNLPIPKEILNAPTQLMKDEGYGEDYELYPEKDKSLLPEKLKGKKYIS